MSINNVILKNNYAELLGSSQLPFEVSPDGEQLRFLSKTTRQNLNIKGKSGSLNVSCNDGHLYLTSKRLVYITGLQGDIITFLVDLQLAPALQFSHKLVAPWFGPNYWEFIFFSTKLPAIASDGFPQEQYFTGDIKFNDGGLFEFVDSFNKVLNDVVNNNHIDNELPRYEA